MQSAPPIRDGRRGVCCRCIQGAGVSRDISVALRLPEERDDLTDGVQTSQVQRDHGRTRQGDTEPIPGSGIACAATLARPQDRPRAQWVPSNRQNFTRAPRRLICTARQACGAPGSVVRYKTKSFAAPPTGRNTTTSVCAAGPAS